MATNPQHFLISFNCPRCERPIKMAAIEKDDKMLELILLKTKENGDLEKNEEGQLECHETPDTTSQCPVE